MRITYLALAALFASATAGRAQEEAQAPEEHRVHQGFWIGGGLGYGSVHPSCDGCGSTTSEGGVSGLLRLGGTLSDQVLLGVESNGWFKNMDGTDNTIGNLSAALYYYPSRKSGVFLKGGVGVAGYEATEGSDKLEGYGLGLMAGAGYDIPIGSHTAITPMATLTYGDVGDLSFNGQKVPAGWKQTLVQFALSISAY
ncbi:MAG TPA: outer membrane beta-barrel protein [Gemmatimonadales bacterium]|nr:outer membrane beta-barrel protein [Gemmatimonadales bacterium]